MCSGTSSLHCSTYGGPPPSCLIFVGHPKMMGMPGRRGGVSQEVQGGGAAGCRFPLTKEDVL